MTFAIIAGVLVFWFVLIWRVGVERGRVGVSDAQRAMIRRRLSILALGDALARALRPAVERATAALVEFGEAMERAGLFEPCPYCGHPPLSMGVSRFASRSRSRRGTRMRNGIHRCRQPGRWRRWREKLGIGSVWRCPGCGEQWAFVQIPAGVDVGGRCWVWPVPSWPEYYPGLDPEALARIQSLSPYTDQRTETERGRA